MPQNIINILDDLLENGSTPEVKAQTAGIKATLEIVADTQEEVAGAMGEIRSLVTSLNDHVKDKECHTPKGILVRGNVIGWMTASVLLLFSLFYVVATVCGVDVLLKAAIP